VLWLRRYERILIKNRRFRSIRASVAKISARKGWLTNQKTGMSDRSCGIRMWAQVSFVLLQSKRLTDSRKDRRTERPWQYRALRYMQSHGVTVTAYALFFLLFIPAGPLQNFSRDISSFLSYLMAMGWLYPWVSHKNPREFSGVLIRSHAEVINIQ